MLKDCIDSILKSSYQDYEIIVVDNNSTDNTVKTIKKKYGKLVTLIESKENLRAGGGRNLGSSYAKGKYLLFIDDDNIIDRKMIENLLNGIRSRKNVGMVGPLMYYFSNKKIIWWAGADINLLTSKTTYVGIGEEDHGQYDKASIVGHIPNVFMLEKRLWKKVGGIDEKYIIHYEESDLAEKLKKNGLKIYRIPKAKTYHRIALEKDNKIRNYAGVSFEKTYYAARNRVIFMKKHSSKINFLMFVIVFNNLFLFHYLLIFLTNKRYSLTKVYFSGYLDGLRYMFNRN